MTKNEEKSVNGNIKFKLKLIKVKEPPIFESLVDKMRPLQEQQNKLNQGIYQQMRGGTKVTYSRKTYSIKDMEDVLKELFYK